MPVEDARPDDCLGFVHERVHEGAGSGGVLLYCPRHVVDRELVVPGIGKVAAEHPLQAIGAGLAPGGLDEAAQYVSVARLAQPGLASEVVQHERRADPSGRRDGPKVGPVKAEVRKVLDRGVSDPGRGGEVRGRGRGGTSRGCAHGSTY